MALEALNSNYCLMVLYVGKEMPITSKLEEQFSFLIKRFNKKQSDEV